MRVIFLACITVGAAPTSDGCLLGQVADLKGKSVVAKHSVIKAPRGAARQRPPVTAESRMSTLAPGAVTSSPATGTPTKIPTDRVELDGGVLTGMATLRFANRHPERVQKG